METDKQSLLKIGELAQIAGVTKRIIRYYEDLGLSDDNFVYFDGKVTKLETN